MNNPKRGDQTFGEPKDKTANKVYEKPVLVFYGDVRDVTLGPTIGGGESGCEVVFRVGPGGCPPP